MIPDNPRAFNCLATLPVDFSKAPDSFSIAIAEKGFRVKDLRITRSTFPSEKIRPPASACVDLLEFPPGCSMRCVMRAVARDGLQCLNVLELAELARDSVILQVFAVLRENDKDWEKVYLLGLGSLFDEGPEKYPVVAAFTSEEILVKEMYVRLFAGDVMPAWLVPVFEK